MTNDAINATFELVGAFIVWINIITLYRDKMVRGIHYSTILFFCSWGGWNVYYYPTLDQWLSGIAGVMMFLTNTIYLIMILYYRHKEKNYNGQVLNNG